MDSPAASKGRAHQDAGTRSVACEWLGAGCAWRAHAADATPVPIIVQAAAHAAFTSCSPTSALSGTRPCRQLVNKGSGERTSRRYAGSSARYDLKGKPGKRSRPGKRLLNGQRQFRSQLENGVGSSSGRVSEQ